jgi:hypothetical protein
MCYSKQERTFIVSKRMSVPFPITLFFLLKKAAQN